MVSLLGGGLFGNPLAGENSQRSGRKGKVLSRGGVMSVQNVGIYFHSLFYTRGSNSKSALARTMSVRNNKKRLYQAV